MNASSQPMTPPPTMAMDAGTRSSASASSLVRICVMIDGQAGKFQRAPNP